MENNIAVSENGSPLLNAPKTTYQYDKLDTLFALLFYALGYGFLKLISPLFTYGVGASLYVFAYAATVRLYLYAKHITPPKAHRFWLCVLLAVGISFSLWENSLFGISKLLFLLAVAVYWTLCATNALLCGKTSAAFLADGVRGFFYFPIVGFGHFPMALLCALKKRVRTVKRQAVLAVLLGALASVILLCMVIPALSAADAVFEAVAGNFINWLVDCISPAECMLLALALLVGAYLFGLVYQSAFAAHMPQADVKRKADALRVVPNISLAVVLGTLSAVYSLFIVLQAGHLFSAFAGQTFGGVPYAEYARSGFFALCRVAAMNALFLSVAAVFARVAWADNKVLRAFSALISVLTLLLIATASAKMLLYISVYGLTAKRFLTTVFLAFLAFVFVLLLLRCANLRRVPFSVARVSLGVFSAGVALLLLVNVGGIITSYNAAQYLAGNIPDYGIDVFWQAGYDGVPAARRINDAKRGDKALLAYMSATYHTDGQADSRWQYSHLAKTLIN